MDDGMAMLVLGMFIGGACMLAGVMAAQWWHDDHQDDPPSTTPVWDAHPEQLTGPGVDPTSLVKATGDAITSALAAQAEILNPRPQIHPDQGVLLDDDTPMPQDDGDWTAGWLPDHDLGATGPAITISPAGVGPDYAGEDLEL